MKKFLTAVALATSALVAVAPAEAVVTFTQTITLTTWVNSGMSGAYAEFGNTPRTDQGTGTPDVATVPVLGSSFAFRDIYNFTYSVPGWASAGVINVRLAPPSQPAQDITFSSITFNGQTGLISNVGGVSTASFENFTFTPGSQQIIINGRATLGGTTTGNGATYGGDLQIFNTAVPEPATWGLMILGFGLVGASMRNRRRSVVAA